MTTNVDAIQGFQTLIGLIRAAVSDSSCDAVQRGLENNASLKQEIENQKKYLDSQGEVFGKFTLDIQTKLNSERAKTNEQTSQINTLVETKTTLTNELAAERTKVAEQNAKLDENAKEISDLQEQLKACHMEIGTLKDTIKEKDGLHNDLQSRFQATGKELNETKGEVAALTKELNGLKKYSCQMQKTTNAEIVQKLKDVYTKIHHLATTFFSEDLPKSIIDDTALWTELRERMQWLPLPQTNTQNAKHMRIAACIGALGSMLAGLIFVPMYIEPDGGCEITNLLYQLSFSHEDMETYLRSVLIQVLPDQQESIRNRRTLQIVDTVNKTFGRLLHDAKKDAFKSGIHEVCRFAVEAWEIIRRVETNVETLYLEFNSTEESAQDFTDKNWSPISLAPKTPMDQAPQPNGSPKTNGTGRKGGRENGRDREVSPTSNGVLIEGNLSTFGHSDVARPLYPGFFVGDELVKGCVLLTSQVRAAREEIGSRRAQRQALRNSSISRPPSYLLR